MVGRCWERVEVGMMMVLAGVAVVMAMAVVRGS